MADYTILATEITNDPLSIGYSGMTNQQIADSLNTPNRDIWVDLNSSQIFEAIHGPEFIALTAANKARVDRILGLGEGIKTSPNSQARSELLAVFGAGSTTIANLASMANPHRSRGVEIGWGIVTVDDVARVR